MSDRNDRNSGNERQRAFARRLERIEREIASVLPRETGPAWLSEVIGDEIDDELYRRIADDVGGIAEPARALLERGGKRWRPLVLVLCAELGGETGDLPYRLSPLVELIHNGSLIVDDIEDGAEERRGLPAIHLLYGVDVAINSGTFLYFLPSFLIERSGASPERKAELSRICFRSLRRLHVGQGLDIAWHRDDRAAPGEEAYLLMCRMKTGCLSGMAAELGAAAAGWTGERVARLGRTFEELGVAFQILDDVRNLTTGNPGKRRGDDIVEGKKSLPVILHLSALPADRDRLASLFSAARSGGIDAPAVEEAIELLTASESVDRAEERARSMIDAVKNELSSSYGGSEGGSLLLSLVESFLDRI